eukprot:5831743-Amphidinium_carterae.2
MKAHQKQETVDRGMVTADDLHGGGQADVLANQGTTLRTRFTTSGDWRDRNFGRDLKLKLESGRQIGKVKGECNFSYLSTGFFAPEVRNAGPCRAACDS